MIRLLSAFSSPRRPLGAPHPETMDVPMSILTDLLGKKITFNQAVAEGAQWVQQLVAHDPTLTSAAGAALADLKQAASNAVDLADKALGAVIAPATVAVEAAAAAAIARAVGPAAVALTPAVDSAIETIAAALKAEIDAAALAAKAQLAKPQPQT